jgi:hypothetical protein
MIVTLARRLDRLYQFVGDLDAQIYALDKQHQTQRPAVYDASRLRTVLRPAVDAGCEDHSYEVQRRPMLCQ